MKKRENIQHKRCVQGVINKTKTTHNCLREQAINVSGDYHFLDVIGHPHKDKEEFFKPFVAECETNMNTAQARSNKLDMLEWKKRYPEGEIFQISTEDEFDASKLNKKPKNTFNAGGFKK